ncbi:MAG: hypothetical protein ACKOYN_09195 [Planctomycetota bacterium]
MRPSNPIALLAATIAAALLALAGRAHAQASCGTATNDCFTTNLTAPGCSNPVCCEAVCAFEPACCEAAWDDLCVVIARKYCSDCGAVPESCFEPHATPSCNNGAVCQAVCATPGFEYCCDTGWDQGCVDTAIALTDKCGEPATGSCLVVHENPNCNDPVCCGIVCSIDPACCAQNSGGWDETCVNWANRFCFSCGNPRAGSCCHQNETPYCNDGPCCEAVCLVDSFCCETRWDTSCGELASALCAPCSRICGYVDPLNPSARSCRVVHAQPGCSEAACCDEVCYFDEFCCAVSWDFTCVEAARAICALTNDPEINAVCGSALGSCFAEHASPGCSDAACCATVCASDPTCCDADAGGWDAACVQRASIVCNGCGEITAGSCLAPHGTPSCLDRACCTEVCDIDPSCCIDAWDILCVLQAGTICVDTVVSCGDPRTRPCNLASFLPACEDEQCCTLVCAYDPTCCSRAWDETCAANSSELCSAPNNCPGPGSPLVVHAQPGCSDLECCAAVCSVDPICCTFGWNERCVSIAKGVCWSYGDCPGEEPCNEPHQSPGCSDATCCSVVCDFDPLCCDVQWNSVCVSAARTLCQPEGNWSCPCAGDCFTAHPANAGCQDEVCCAGVCNTDPACCTEAWDEGCATLARAICCGVPGCGDNCAGSCLESHTTPFCSDPACCEAVCRFEPYCCDVRWDTSCVIAARQTCFGGCGQISSGNCFNAHDTAGCSIGECCSTVCDDPMFAYCCIEGWDADCATQARKVCDEFLPQCGDIGLDGCNVPHAGPACADAGCCDSVCKADAFCCDSEWDEACVQLVYTSADCDRYQFDCGSPCAGTCCEPHGTPWCNDKACCEAVCLEDNFCCTVQWDEFCAQTANLVPACSEICPDPK